MITWKQIILFSFLLSAISFLTSCKSDYIPPKHPSLSEGQYKKYVSNLNKAYQFKVPFQIALQLANLKADPELVYGKLESSLKLDPNSCLKIYSSKLIYEETGQELNIYKLDTPRFLEAMDLCGTLLGADSYDNFKNKHKQEQERRLAERPVLDSTLFDQSLIAQLEKINQSLNGEKNKQTDRANFLAISDLLQKHGYPSKELVGYGTASVIYEVLQAQDDIRIRSHFQSLLKGNISKNKMRLYKDKTKTLMVE